MVDVTYRPAKRRKCDGPSNSGEISHQIHDRGRVPPTQWLPLPRHPPPHPGQTDGHVDLLEGVGAMSHLAGADGRQIQPVAAGHMSDLALPSPPPEDEQFEVLPSPNTVPCRPVAIAAWTQGLSFTGVSPFGQPVATWGAYGNSPLTAMPALLANPAPTDDLESWLEPWLFEPQAGKRRQCTPVRRSLGASPFKDCPRKLGNRNHRGFNLPADGQVNGYIKFSSTNKQGRRALASWTVPLVSLSESQATLEPAAPCQRATNMTHDIAQHDSQLAADYGGSSRLGRINANLGSYGRPMGSPQLLPESFGFDAKMDAMDGLLWAFYINAWCPGRSVLRQTNLWLKDFAPMHKSDGVRAAIQGLAGLYVYDYRPNSVLERRVIRKFAEAESCYSELLADPSTARRELCTSEAITLAVLLAMQDIVLTERRLKWPQKPRWLLGFQQAEFFLEEMSQAAQHRNIPLSSLCVSQRVIVGRALILAQLMVPLPTTFDPQVGVARFGWLLDGFEFPADLLEIHGGCGFSRKLLHTMGQITYCAARLHHDPENVVAPISAEYLLEELLQMRQWSKEFDNWETVSNHWLFKPDDYKIESSAEMTQATAEAWRLAAIIYLRCRVLRLPRSHPDVVSTLDNLAACIRAMPTSGFQFTAQAPLFPVFLLGVVATRTDHKGVSKAWFDEVVSTPVRSSVPPLYRALQRIWQWIDHVEEKAIAEHLSWWELLVEEVNKREAEMPCLT
ncbi:transcriptional regulator family: Fungal Specific TF [Purpureocillium lilacinum]|uniref:Transcriptional regulator family: Fungal Specific TF n=1 Tax=Purpureocillium lilacinum TaxID=33203 RepID=A0ABR0BFR5_PURLI|nr:transcriptional regulator family: Fungal Specific TF [Purpureocillium lilacinum]